MRLPRGLSETEQRAWARLASSVTPLQGKKMPGKKAPLVEAKPETPTTPSASPPLGEGTGVGARRSSPRSHIPTQPPPHGGGGSRLARSSQGLDGSWNRKLKAGQIAPDYTLDLHGHNLDGAYDRIMSGLDQARMMDARVVLVIAGRERPVDPADRGSMRGAIRAKLLDWLAVSRHADSIAAVRRAHIRHGGEGALYLVLKRSG